MDSMQHSVLIKCTYSKTTSSSLLNAPKQHTIQTRSPARKNITTKLLFRLNTSLFWSTKWKSNSSLWPHGASAADIVTNEPVINKTLIYIYIVYLIVVFTEHDIFLLVSALPLPQREQQHCTDVVQHPQGNPKPHICHNMVDPPRWVLASMWTMVAAVTLVLVISSSTFFVNIILTLLFNRYNY